MIEWKLHAPSTFQVTFYFYLFFPEFDSTLNVNSWNGSISNGEDPEYFHIYVGMPELSSLKYWKQFHRYGALCAKSDAAFGRKVNSSSKSGWSEKKSGNLKIVNKNY